MFKLGAYALLGVVLSICGITILDHTWKFLLIMGNVVLIDILARFDV